MNQLAINGLKNLLINQRSENGTLLFFKHSLHLELDARILAMHAEIYGIQRAHNSKMFESIQRSGRLKSMKGITDRNNTLAFMRWLKQGKTVLLSACDTFRAAAIEQLEVWAKRADVQIVVGENGSDPASLAYKSLTKAIEEKVDVLIIDTAGRLQVKNELMEELKKIIRVLGKKLEGCPHDRIIVLDGATGQNAHSQMDEFSKAIDISGVIVTKLDGSAKGGIVVSLADRFGLPIHSVGALRPSLCLVPP